VIKSRVFLITLFVLLSMEAKALTWDDLWLNPDEQGYKALKQNDLQQATANFNSPEWQGIVYYRLKEYKKALAAFSKGTDATAFYNSGNALALLGHYPEAINAYDKALALNASFDDARFNRDLLKKLLNSPPPGAPAAQTAPPFKQRYNKNQNAAQNATQTPTDNNAAAKNAPQNNPQPLEQPQRQDQSQTQSQDQPQSGSTQQPPIDTNANPGSVSNSYQDQQQQQALQNINDDPGGLLQRKLERDYEQSQQQGN
jgi:Ca-activated chloride channel family protein